MYQLTNKYWIDADEENWLVGKRYKDNRSGKHYLRDPRFFSRIDGALAWVMDQELKSCASVSELFARIEELRKSLINKTDFMRQ